MCFSILSEEKVMSVSIEDDLYFHLAQNIWSNDARRAYHPDDPVWLPWQGTRHATVLR